jgi:uncharacterized protein (DUF2062 family)
MARIAISNYLDAFILVESHPVLTDARPLGNAELDAVSMKKWLKRYTPSRDELMRSKWLRPFGFALSRPGVWQLNRRSAALGAAIGLITGLFPGPTQILFAVVLAWLLKANLPTAALATFYTNPITIVPLYLLAYRIGTFVTGEEGEAPPMPAFSFSDPWEFFTQSVQWVIGLGDTLLIGLAVQAALFAIAGYLLVIIIWRVSVGRRWCTRRTA